MLGAQPAVVCAAAIASAICAHFAMTEAAVLVDPMRRQSNTVVMPDDATCASCAWTAAVVFQRTPGRGDNGLRDGRCAARRGRG